MAEFYEGIEAEMLIYDERPDQIMNVEGEMGKEDDEEFQEVVEEQEIEEDIFGEPEQPIVVDTFKDQQRAGGMRWGLATEIEGKGNLAKTSERRNRMDPDIRLSSQLENYFSELRSYYNFGPSDREELLHLLMNVTPNKYFKNPNMFILGFVLQKTIRANGLKVVTELIKKTNQIGVSEMDVIRYYRLLEEVLPRQRNLQ